MRVSSSVPKLTYTVPVFVYVISRTGDSTAKFRALQKQAVSTATPS
jgi:hypothetical protein